MKKARAWCAGLCSCCWPNRLFLLVGGVIGLTAADENLGSVTRHQALGALAAVDVTDHQVGQDVRSQPGAGSQLLDLRVIHREGADLANQRRLDEQLAVAPEVGVTGQNSCQGDHEGRSQVSRPLLEDDPLNAPTGVDQLEERLDVLAERAHPDVLHDCVETGGDIVDARVATRPEMAVQIADHLQIGHRRHQLFARHALRPADPPTHGECLVVRQAIQNVDRLVVIPQVPRQDVGAELGPVHVQDPEPFAFPGLVGVEVDGGAESRLSVAVDLHQPHRSVDPLKAIDDVDVAGQDEDAVLVVVIAGPKTEIHIRNGGAALERLDHRLERGQRQDLPLIIADLQHMQVGRVERAA